MFSINIKVKFIDDLVRCVNLSSLLELSGWPKPGNVHRTSDFEDTRFEHFLAGIIAIQPNFRELCEKINNSIESDTQDFSSIELGDEFWFISFSPLFSNWFFFSETIKSILR